MEALFGLLKPKPKHNVEKSESIVKVKSKLPNLVYRLDNYIPKSIEENGSILEEKTPHLLCFHGKGTSHDILWMQTTQLRIHTKIKCTFLCSPFPFLEPQDEMVSLIFANLPYYDWKNKDPSKSEEEKNEAQADVIEQIINFIQHNGPFDGLLGFSQGCDILTQVLNYFTVQQKLSADFKHSIKFAVLIGGALPNHLEKELLACPLAIPSLHIWGKKDYILLISQRLEKLYSDGNVDEKILGLGEKFQHTTIVSEKDKENSKNDEKNIKIKYKTIMIHEEGHQIPSLKTNLYGDIKEWIYKHNFPQLLEEEKDKEGDKKKEEGKIEKDKLISETERTDKVSTNGKEDKVIFRDGVIVLCSNPGCEESKGLHACTRCKNTFYCGRSCQSKDWPSHKLTCATSLYNKS